MNNNDIISATLPRSEDVTNEKQSCDHCYVFMYDNNGVLNNFMRFKSANFLEPCMINSNNVTTVTICVDESKDTTLIEHLDEFVKQFEIKHVYNVS